MGQPLDLAGLQEMAVALRRWLGMCVFMRIVLLLEEQSDDDDDEEEE